MTPIVLVLPYPLSANRYWRNVIIGRSARTLESREAKAYKADVASRARAAGIQDPAPGRVHVHLQLYPERPLDWAKRAQRDPSGWDDRVRCIDLDNARKVVYDALKGIAFLDDGLVFADSAERMEPDEHGGRAVVTINAYARELAQERLVG